jgi:hypothetical protein
MCRFARLLSDLTVAFLSHVVACFGQIDPTDARCASDPGIRSSSETMLTLAPPSVSDDDIRRACEVTFAVILDNDVG